MRYTRSSDSWSELTDVSGINTVSTGAIYTALEAYDRTVVFTFTINTGGANPQNCDSQIRITDNSDNVAFSSVVEFDFKDQSPVAQDLEITTLDGTIQRQNNKEIFDLISNSTGDFSSYVFPTSLNMTLTHSSDVEYLRYLEIDFNSTSNNVRVYQNLWTETLGVNVWSGDFEQVKQATVKPYKPDTDVGGTWWREENTEVQLITAINQTWCNVVVNDIYLMGMVGESITCTVRVYDRWESVTNTDTVVFTLGDEDKSTHIENAITDHSYEDLTYEEIVENSIIDTSDVSNGIVGEVVELSIVTLDPTLDKSKEENDDENIDTGIIILLNGVQVVNSFNITTKEYEINSIKLYDSKDNRLNTDDWMYMGEVYTLIMETYNPSYAQVNFTDGEREIKFTYSNETGLMSYDTANDEYVIGMPYTNFEIIETSTGLSKLTWKFILDKNVVDKTNVKFSALTNSTINVPQGEIDTEIDFLTVNIYNLGGNAGYTFTGDGSRIQGGDVFELEAMVAGSSAKAETIFKRLQHVHMLVELNHNGTWNPTNGDWEDFDGGYFEYGIDYEMNGEWVQGWKVRMYPTNYLVGHQNSGSDHNWVGWSVEWYSFNDGTGIYDKIKEDIIYSNSWSYDTEGSTNGYINRTSSQMWIDLWFNRMNSSTVIGGRVNAYYYGMYEKGNLWFGYGTFSPMFGDTTASMYFNDLYDEDGNIKNCYKIEKVKFWSKVTKISGSDRTWKMHNYQILDWKVADDRMEGINTPVLIETKVLDMPQGGFMTPLVNAIGSIGNLVWKGALGFIRVFIGAIDSFLVYLGLPVGTFSALMDFVAIQISVVFGWLEIVALYAGQTLAIFVSIIDWTLSIMTMLLEAISWFIIWVVPLPIHLLNFMYCMFTSTEWVWGNVSFDFSGNVDIMSAVWAIAPYGFAYTYVSWLFFGKNEDDIEGLPYRIIQTFQFIRDGYTAIFWIFSRMRNEIISMYNFIRSHIPAMGGSGGETEE